MYTILDFLNANSGAIQVIFTVVLVLVTIYYSYQARQTVIEASNSRKDNRLPIVEIEIRGPIENGKQSESKKYISLYAKNIGYGLAQNVKVFFPGKKFLALRNLDHEDKNKSFLQINLEHDEEKELAQMTDEEKVITLEYYDIFGRKISTIAHFAYKHKGNWEELSIIDWRLVF